MRTGTIISGTAHVAMMAAVLLGDLDRPMENDIELSFTDISVITEAELSYLTSPVPVESAEPVLSNVTEPESRSATVQDAEKLPDIAEPAELAISPTVKPLDVPDQQETDNFLVDNAPTVAQLPDPDDLSENLPNIEPLDSVTIAETEQQTPLDQSASEQLPEVLDPDQAVTLVEVSPVEVPADQTARDNPETPGTKPVVVASQANPVDQPEIMQENSQPIVEEVASVQPIAVDAVDSPALPSQLDPVEEEFESPVTKPLDIANVTYPDDKLAPEEARPEAAPRVFTEAAPKPDPFVEIADELKQATRPDPSAENRELPVVEQATAPQHAAPRIVTEAEKSVDVVGIASPKRRPDFREPSFRQAVEQPGASSSHTEIASPTVPDLPESGTLAPSANVATAPRIQVEDRELASLVAVVSPKRRPTPDSSEPSGNQNSAQSSAADAVAQSILNALQQQTKPSSVSAKTPSDPKRLGGPLTLSEKDRMRLAIRRCWNTGALSSEALFVTVIVGFRLNEDGTLLAGSIRLSSSEGGSGVAVDTAFQAAKRAITRCTQNGLDLPKEKYASWREVEIEFNPATMRLK